MSTHVFTSALAPSPAVPGERRRAGRDRPPGRLRSAVAAVVLSAGVVASEHLTHGTTTGLIGDAGHVLRDGALGLPLAYVAVRAGMLLARWGSANRGVWRQTVVQAAATSFLFGLLLMPGVVVHERLDAALARPHATTSSGEVDDQHTQAHATLTDETGLAHAVRHGGRVTWTALPLAVLAVMLLRPRRHTVTAPHARSGAPRRQPASHARLDTPRPRRAAFWPVAVAVGLGTSLVSHSDRPAGAASATVSETEAIATGCSEVGAVVSLPYERVRAHVPPEFKLRPLVGGGLTGMADVFVRAYKCEEQTIGADTVQDTTTVNFGAFIDDRQGIPAVYTFSYITDNPHLPPWMKAGTGMDRVRYVAGLSMTQESIGGASRYRVVAGAPAPSPFQMTATAAPANPQASALTGRWWSELPPNGTGHRSYFRFTNQIPAFRLAGGLAQIEAAPGSPMAEVFGSSRVTTYSVGGDFDSQVTTWTVHSAPPSPRS